MFNIARAMGLLRLVLSFGGGATLTAAGFNGDAISHAVAGATTPGGLLLGVAPFVAAGLWSYAAHGIGATVDRAVGLTGGPASPLAPVAAPAILAGRLKTHLSPNG